MMGARWSSRTNLPTPEQSANRARRRAARRAKGITTSGARGLLDHGTNPRSRKAARDGERRHDQEGPR